ncbi:MAG: YwqG family protein [Pseudomonadota bacterium]|nr:YwqG family protein [Pseudomonadota bacterium]
MTHPAHPTPAPPGPDPFSLASHPALHAQLAALAAQTSAHAQARRFVLTESRLAVVADAAPPPQPLPLGASRTGGDPDLPEGMAHPADADGRLYQFLAQLHLPDLAPLQPWLPRTGLLSFFVGDAMDGSAPHVLHLDVPREHLRRWRYGPDSRWLNPDLDASTQPDAPDWLRRPPEQALHWRLAASLPWPWSRPHHLALRHPHWAHALASETPDHWQPAIAELTEHLLTADEGSAPPLLASEQAHALNGWIATQHASPEEQAAETLGGEPVDWLVLLALRSAGGLGFGDAGTLSFCIQRQALAAGDFSAVHASVES